MADDPTAYNPVPDQPTATDYDITATDNVEEGAPPVPAETPPAVVHTAPQPVMPPTTPQSNEDLVGLKQKALEALTPLVNHLDQTPEEKFKTTMMMIQANDNKDLLPEAYAAAQNIEDEKARAQALLDVINEINYFSQPTE
jgi:hypothetical protein